MKEILLIVGVILVPLYIANKSYDMGYIFEAIFENETFFTSRVRDGRVCFEDYENQDCLVKFMKV